MNGTVEEMGQEKKGLCKNAKVELFTNIQYYQEAWQKGMITNGDYLLYLNFISHRSFNDATQYPVFPWIL